MKYLKWIFGILALLILVFVLLCFLGPKKLDFDNSLKMKAGAPQVYQLVNNLKNWESWNDWSKVDTTMVMTYPGKIEGVGAMYNWKGDISSAGSYEIIEAEKNKRIKSKMMFEGFDGYTNGEWTFTPDGKDLDVNWKIVNKDEIPFMYRGMLLVTGRKGKVNKQYKRSLENIKAIAEQRAKGIYNGYKINNVQLEDKYFITKRAKVDMNNITNFYARNLPAIASKVGQSGIEMDGMPCGLFYSWDTVNKQTDMAAAIPTKSEVAIKGFSSVKLPGKKAVQVDYYGDYDGTVKGHDAISAYLVDQGFFNDYPVIEQYITDPSTESDASKWLTKITYYIANEE